MAEPTDLERVLAALDADDHWASSADAARLLREMDAEGRALREALEKFATGNLYADDVERARALLARDERGIS